CQSLIKRYPIRENEGDRRSMLQAGIEVKRELPELPDDDQAHRFGIPHEMMPLHHIKHEISELDSDSNHRSNPPISHIATSSLSSSHVQTSNIVQQTTQEASLMREEGERQMQTLAEMAREAEASLDRMDRM
ncbi:hypothetical protein PFISCL1PPCAC_23955, partial [Pristionchus fissidentatus]